jgi:hypothetical protein
MFIDARTKRNKKKIKGKEKLTKKYIKLLITWQQRKERHKAL